MTDKDIADKVYIEPLTVRTLEKIIEVERPDSILPTLADRQVLTLPWSLRKRAFSKSSAHVL